MELPSPSQLRPVWARMMLLVAFLALLGNCVLVSGLSFDSTKTAFLRSRPMCSYYNPDLDTLWVFSFGTAPTAVVTKYANITLSPAYIFSNASTTAATYRATCVGMAQLDDSLLLCLGGNIHEYSATTLLPTRTRFTLPSGTFSACKFDPVNGRLFGLSSVSTLYGFRVTSANLANNAVFQAYSTDSSVRFGTGCDSTTGRRITLGNRFGYLSCNSIGEIPKVLLFELTTPTITLRSDPPIGLAAPTAMHYSRATNKLFMFAAGINVAYFYDVDEAAERFTLSAIHLKSAPSTRDFGPIFDAYSGVAIWISPAALSAAVSLQYTIASIRPEKFGSLYVVTPPPVVHPGFTVNMTAVDTSNENFYVFGERGFALILMLDSASNGAVAWMNLSDCSVYSTCSTCLGTGDPFCSWCLQPSGSSAPDGVCREKRTCSFASEPDACPIVDTITPTSGSIFGQTPLAATGTSLSGANFRFRFTSADNAAVFVDTAAQTLDPVRTLVGGSTQAVPSPGNYSVTLIRQATTTASAQIYRYETPKTFIFYNCSEFDSCSSCAQASRSECGWCLFDARCISTRDQCATPDSPLVRYDTVAGSASCPTITALSPNSSLSTPLPGVQLRVSATRLFSSPITPGFQCVYNFSTPIIVSATFDSAAGQLVCPIPTPPTIAAVSLSVNFRGRPFSANSLPFEYYLCSLFSSCSSCIDSTKTLCNWCLSTRTCQLSNATCADAEGSTCPAVLSLSPPSTYEGEAALITVSGGRFTSGGNYQCQFGSIATVSATRISETTLTCQAPAQTGFTSPLDVALTILRDGSVYADQTASFRYYKCDATSCGGCLGPLQPRCGYCVNTGVCAERTTLSGCTASRVDSCPTISSVTPSGSTPSGNINITIVGEFLIDVPYTCVFTLGSNVNFSSVATSVSTSSILCLVPNVSEIVTNTIQASIAVYANQTNGELVPYSSNSLPFRYVVCGQQSSCSSCTLAPQCAWCDLRTCAERTSGFSCPLGVEYNSSYSCPTVSSVTPNNAQVDSTTNVIIRGSNFISSPRLRLFCSWGDYFLTTADVLSDTTISCQYRIPFGVAAPPLQPLEITVRSSSSGLLALTSLAFDIYNCTATSNNCTHCASNPSPYCGWCVDSYECVAASSCVAGATWLSQSCPTITRVNPSFTLVSGGSQVTLTGDFFVPSETATLSLDCSFDGQVSPGQLTNASSITCDVPSVTSTRVAKVSVVQGGGVRTFVDNTINLDYITCSASRCGECFNPPGSDPRCTWCPYEQTCTSADKCSAANPLVSTAASCPAIVGLSPSAARLAGGVPIFISGTLFVNHPNFTCQFGNLSVPATFVNSSLVSCTSPPAANGTANVPFRLLLNGQDYASSVLTFEFADTPAPPDQSGVAAPSGLGGGFIALVVLLILFAIAIAGGILIFLYVRRKHEDDRKAAAWLKLRTPDFAKFAVALPKDLDFEISTKDIPKLAALEAFLLRDTNFAIVSALAKVIADRELDSLAKAMTWFFTCHSRSLEMMLHFVNAEIDIADSEGTLFRSTSAAAKIFNQYARYVGLPYLWNNLAYYVNLLHEYGKEERKDQRDDILGPGTMEVDPERYDDEPLSEVDVRLNQLELLVRASKMLKSITKSVNQLPPEFRILCKQVKSKIAVKFATGNNADYKSVGGFLFLRYICPAITTPHVYGLLEEPPNEMSQRYFILIAKLLQSLANEAPPGQKEEYMVKLNDFVVNHIPVLHSWADHVVDIDDESQRSVTPTISDERKNQCLAHIAHLLNEYLEQLYTVKGLDKDLYDELDKLLQNMGSPGKLREDKTKKKGAKAKQKRPLKEKERDN